jgi:adenosylcobinamide-GDP ribazoletransferase
LLRPLWHKLINNEGAIMSMAYLKDSFVIWAVRLCVAMRFLTLIPISWRTQDDSQLFADSLVFFPIVGIVIGGIGTLAGFMLGKFLPLSVVAILCIIYLAFISGCLHLDGLSDSADGLLSSRPRKESLAIMKDSRAGAMGIVVVVLLFVTKFAALSAMPRDTLLAALFLMPLAGRCAILLTMAYLPYAREQGGLGGLFYSGNSKKAATIACVVLFSSIIFLRPGHLLSVLIGFLAVVYLFNRWCKAKLGGATGDTLGAVCELTEMIVAVSLTVSFPIYFY